LLLRMDRGGDDRGSDSWWRRTSTWSSWDASLPTSAGLVGVTAP